MRTPAAEKLNKWANEKPELTTGTAYMINHVGPLEYVLVEVKVENGAVVAIREMARDIKTIVQSKAKLASLGLLEGKL